MDFHSLEYRAEIGALFPSPPDQDFKLYYAFEVDHAHALLQLRIKELEALINNPHTVQFLEGVQREAAHQRERWGLAHDREKSAEAWYWLCGYLAGKALRSHITGDKEKALHHTISTAAALSNWHDSILTDSDPTGAAPDKDLAQHDAP